MMNAQYIQRRASRPADSFGRQIGLPLSLAFSLATSSILLAEDGVYIQRNDPDGLICIEAEDFVSREGREGHTWEIVDAPAGSSGPGAMQALPDVGESEGIDYDDSPFADYTIHFIRSGKHYVWMRGRAIQPGDSAELDLDRRKFGTATEMEFEVDEWSWAFLNDDQEPAWLEVDEPGARTVSLCMREDGAIVDKIVLTTNPDFRPEGLGPPATSRGAGFSFATDTLGHPETADEEISIPVHLDRASAGSFSVDYSVAGGTAGPDDFDLPNGTLSFGPEEQVREIKVRIAQDGMDEPDETILIELSNPGGEAAQLGVYPVTSYVIGDPRPVVEFARTTSGVAEEEGSVDIPLRLSAPYGIPITVTCAVIGGSADETDSALESPQVTFAPGQVEAMVRIRVFADETVETSETIRLGLIEAENATLKGRNHHDVIICHRNYSALGGAYYFRYDSNERWETFAKVGPYADAMIRLMPGHDRLVFWRGSSYLPFLEIEDGKSFAEIEVSQNGDGEGRRFDEFCKHAHVRIVEASDARVRVMWRYVPDMDNSEPQGWTEEFFTVYPDGSCFRSIVEGTETLEEYVNPDHPRTEVLLLTGEGVCPMPRSWIQTVSLDLDDATLEGFEDLGYDEAQGCYVLATRESGVPGTVRAVLNAGITNLALRFQGWGDGPPTITVDGEAYTDFQSGSYRRMENDDLILWLGKSFPAGTEIVIQPSGEIPPVVRRPVRDPYLSPVALFPEGSEDPGPFGAFYTTLKYWDEWDEPWRTGDFADVVVQFDQSPDRLVFWRGTTYVPHWVNESNFWYENEFSERRGEDSGVNGLCEPMQDHESRFSRVRIIHSTPARALVHWRYASTTLSHQFFGVDETGWGDWVDDYYYVYPDETCVRDTTLYTSKTNVFHEWHEAIPLVNPGMIPEDVLEPETLAVANTAGQSRLYDFSEGFPPNSEFEDGMNILLVRMKGKGKPFAIAESSGVWWDPISRPDDGMFNHYDDWPAWPKAYRRGDWDRDPDNGYREFWKILPSHSSLMHLNWDNYESSYSEPFSYIRRVLLNGMTQRDDVTALIPLARFWENAPPVETVGYGFSPAYFEKSQKAYLLNRRISWDPVLVNRDDDRYPNPKADKVDLRILASAESPLVNPAFVIRNWPVDTRARLFINGEPVPSGEPFRQGIERNLDQSRAIDTLVVWVECQFEEPVTITLEME